MIVTVLMISKQKSLSESVWRGCRCVVRISRTEIISTIATRATLIAIIKVTTRTTPFASETILMSD